MKHKAWPSHLIPAELSSSLVWPDECAVHKLVAVSFLFKMTHAPQGNAILKPEWLQKSANFSFAELRIEFLISFSGCAKCMMRLNFLTHQVLHTSLLARTSQFPRLHFSIQHKHAL